MTRIQTDDLLAEGGWRGLIGRLPAEIDVACSARKRRAFLRARGVASAEVLLRLALIYGATTLSLRGTAAWAAANGLADISDVALLGRLQAADAWLGDVVGALLTSALAASRPPDDSPAGPTERTFAGRRLRIVDATTVTSPGTAAAWRVHADYDAAAGRFVDLALTDGHDAESLARFAPEPGDLVVADRYYAKARQLHHVATAGADYLVRRGLTSCTLRCAGGGTLDIKALLAAAAAGETLDIPVQVPPPAGDDAPPLVARLILRRLPEEHIAGARRRAAKRAGKEMRPLSGKRALAAQVCMLMTSLDRETADTDTVLSLYRLRWQVELAFKRLKSLARLADLQAKDPRLVRSCVFAKLIVALLAEEATQDLLESFP